jgi:Cdc6-like AAA superfamily ATPase
MIHFQPYDWQQIGEILDSRLSDCGRYIHKDVIKLASRKVANMSGDIRKVNFNTCDVK